MVGPRKSRSSEKKNAPDLLVSVTAAWRISESGFQYAPLSETRQANTHPEQFGPVIYFRGPYSRSSIIETIVKSSPTTPPVRIFSRYMTAERTMAMTKCIPTIVAISDSGPCSRATRKA